MCFRVVRKKKKKKKKKKKNPEKNPGSTLLPNRPFLISVISKE
jgi:hypothetical protein